MVVRPVARPTAGVAVSAPQPASPSLGSENAGSEFATDCLTRAWSRRRTKRAAAHAQVVRRTLDDAMKTRSWFLLVTLALVASPVFAGIAIGQEDAVWHLSPDCPGDRTVRITVRIRRSRSAADGLREGTSSRSDFHGGSLIPHGNR